MLIAQRHIVLQDINTAIAHGTCEAAFIGDVRNRIGVVYRDVGRAVFDFSLTTRFSNVVQIRDGDTLVVGCISADVDGREAAGIITADHGAVACSKRNVSRILVGGVEVVADGEGSEGSPVSALPNLHPVVLAVRCSQLSVEGEGTTADGVRTTTEEAALVVAGELAVRHRYLGRDVEQCTALIGNELTVCQCDFAVGCYRVFAGIGSHCVIATINC